MNATGRTIRTAGGRYQVSDWEALQRPGRRGPRPFPGVIFDNIPNYDDFGGWYPARGPRTLHIHHGPTIGPNFGRMGFGDIGARRRHRIMDMMAPWMDDVDDDDFEDFYDDLDDNDGYAFAFGGGGGRRYRHRGDAALNMHRLGGGAPRALRTLDWRPEGGAGFGRQRQGARDFVMY